MVSKRENGVVGFADRLAAKFDTDRALAPPDVDPPVGVGGMHEDFLVLFEPVIHLVPIEGEMAVKRAPLPKAR